MPKNAISDPRNYARNAVPFATPQEANAALQAFLEGLRKLRDEHRMCDVGVVVGLNVEYPEQPDEDGKPTSGTAMVHAHLGATHMAAALMAFGYGEASAD